MGHTHTILAESGYLREDDISSSDAMSSETRHVLHSGKMEALMTMLQAGQVLSERARDTSLITYFLLAINLGNLELQAFPSVCY